MTRPRPCFMLILAALAGCPQGSDVDGDGFDADVDCDDNNALIHPNAAETCNGRDDDCDESIDEAAIDAPAWFPDDDADGYGHLSAPLWACDPPALHVADSSDCDDTDPKIHPGAPETCDGVDEDCDGLQDEGGVCGEVQCDDGVDDDQDGLIDCDDPDCDGACPERCDDARDNDADGAIDCRDSDCWSAASCVERDCDDGADNESDGLTDCDDPDCWGEGCREVLYRVTGGTLAVNRETTTWREKDCVGPDCETGVERSQNVQLYDITGELRVHLSEGWRTCSWSYDRGVLSDTLHDGMSVASRAAREGFAIEAGCGLTDARFLPRRLIYTERGLLTLKGQLWFTGYGFEQQRRASDLEHPDRTGDVVRDLLFYDPLSPATPLGHCDDGRIWQAWPDSDGDGFGENGPGVVSCQPIELADSAGDCDDGRADLHPAAVEVCGDALDNNCDGTAACAGPSGRQSIVDARRVTLGTVADGAPRVWSIGDADGDRLSDLAVSWPHNDEAGKDAGLVQILFSSNPDAMWEGVAAGDLAGASVSSAGDHDGDGIDDLLIGATGVVVDGEARSGSVYLLTDATAGGSLSDNAARIWMRGGWVGTRVDHLGDIDGDGWPEIAIGAQTTAMYGTNSGGVYIFHGPLEGALSLDDADWSIHGAHRHDVVGDALAGVGDVDGDGAPDLLIGHHRSSLGASEAGAAHLFLTLPEQATIEEADATWTGDLREAWSGESVGPTGDMNDDGYADMWIAAPRTWGYAPRPTALSGAIYLIYGSSKPSDAPLRNANAVIRARRIYDLAGVSVSGGRDIDGDGVPDLVIGAPGDDGAAPNAGVVAIFMGSIEGQLDLHDAQGQWQGASPGEQVGSSVALLDDADGDGRADIAVGSIGGDGRGSVWMIAGGQGW